MDRNAARNSRVAARGHGLRVVRGLLGGRNFGPIAAQLWRLLGCGESFWNVGVLRRYGANNCTVPLLIEKTTMKLRKNWIPESTIDCPGMTVTRSEPSLPPVSKV